MTRGELKQIVLEELENIAPEADWDAIDATADLREELDLDSMDFLNFVIALHERLGVDIPESEYGKLGSVDAVVTYLASKTQQ